MESSFPDLAAIRAAFRCSVASRCSLSGLETHESLGNSSIASVIVNLTQKHTKLSKQKST